MHRFITWEVKTQNRAKPSDVLWVLYLWILIPKSYFDSGPRRL